MQSCDDRKQNCKKKSCWDIWPISIEDESFRWMNSVMFGLENVNRSEREKSGGILSQTRFGFGIVSTLTQRILSTLSLSAALICSSNGWTQRGLIHLSRMKNQESELD